jgi:hypothetical protein
MNRLLALVLSLFLFANAAFAGVNSNEARYVGGTTTTVPIRATGYIDDLEQSSMAFRYDKGKSPETGSFRAGTLYLPYASITSIQYGQHKNLRIGETIALTAVAGAGGLLLLLSKSKTHYVTIQYKDAAAKDQLAVFEVGKNVIRPILSSLEVRTGKKVEYEASATGKQSNQTVQP